MYRITAGTKRILGTAIRVSTVQLCGTHRWVPLALPNSHLTQIVAVICVTGRKLALSDCNVARHAAAEEKERDLTPLLHVLLHLAPDTFFFAKKKIFSTPAACHATFWCKIASFGCNADCCHNLFCMWIHQCKSKIHLICVTKKSSYGTLWPVWYQKYYWIKLEAKSMLYASIFISLTPLSYHFIFYHFIFALNQHLKQKCPLDFDHT